MKIDDDELIRLLRLAYEENLRSAPPPYPAKAAIYRGKCPDKDELGLYRSQADFPDRPAIGDHVERYGCPRCRAWLHLWKLADDLRAGVGQVAVLLWQLPMRPATLQSAPRDPQLYSQTFPYPDLNLDVTIEEDEHHLLTVWVKTKQQDRIGYIVKVIIAFTERSVLREVDIPLAGMAALGCAGMASLGQLSELLEIGPHFLTPEVILKPPSGD